MKIYRWMRTRCRHQWSHVEYRRVISTTQVIRQRAYNKRNRCNYIGKAKWILNHANLSSSGQMLTILLKSSPPRSCSGRCVEQSLWCFSFATCGGPQCASLKLRLDRASLKGNLPFSFLNKPWMALKQNSEHITWFLWLGLTGKLPSRSCSVF